MNETKERIFNEAKRLFETKGFYKTTVRDITNAADVNLGLFSYYFKSKYNLALQVYDKFDENVSSFTEEYLGHIENPAVAMGIMMRMNTYAMNDDQVIIFTIDALKEGLLETSFIRNGFENVSDINSYYNTGLSEDELKILLAGTLGIERSLITHNYLGLFHSDLKTLSDYVFRTHLFSFGLDRKEIENCLMEVHKHFQKLLDEIPDFIRKNPGLRGSAD